MPIKFSTKEEGAFFEMDGSVLGFRRISSLAFSRFLMAADCLERKNYKTGKDKEGNEVLEFDPGTITGSQAAALAEASDSFLADNLLSGILEDPESGQEISVADLEAEQKRRLIQQLSDVPEFVEWSDLYKQGTEKKSEPVAVG